MGVQGADDWIAYGTGGALNFSEIGGHVGAAADRINNTAAAAQLVDLFNKKIARQNRTPNGRHLNGSTKRPPTWTIPAPCLRLIIIIILRSAVINDTYHQYTST